MKASRRVWIQGAPKHQRDGGREAEGGQVSKQVATGGDSCKQRYAQRGVQPQTLLVQAAAIRCGSI